MKEVTNTKRRGVPEPTASATAAVQAPENPTATALVTRSAALTVKVVTNTERHGAPQPTTPTTRIVRVLRDIKTITDALTAVTQSATKLAGALTGLVVAAGVLWAAAVR